jgi:hypothetical protein
LKPCPFCESAMKISPHSINPWAICPTDGCIGARQALVLDDPRQVAAWNRRPSSAWQPIETAPTSEEEPFLVLLPKNDVAPFVILQVSRFEGRLYPDALDACIDWENGVTTATHWMKCPALGQLPAQVPIPLDVYYRAESNNFYDMRAKVGMGMGFWRKWRDRKHEFPTVPGAPS